MTWSGFAVKTLGLLVFFWLLMIFGYGNFFLMDTVVPVEGIEVDEWINGYRTCGGVSGLLGFICAAIWFAIGNGYAGEGGISIKYYGLWILAAVLGVGCNFVLLPGAVEGSGLASLFVILLPILVYYLSSIIAYAPAVKYIPLLADAIHK